MASRSEKYKYWSNLQAFKLSQSPSMPSTGIGGKMCQSCGASSYFSPW